MATDRSDQIKRLCQAVQRKGPAERALFLEGLGTADAYNFV